MTYDPMLSLSADGIEYTVWFDRWDAGQPNRPQFGYTIREDNGHRNGTMLAEGDDLRGGCGQSPNLVPAMESLLTFLGAFLESRRYGNPESENWDLFPDACAAIDSDHVAMLEMSISESEDA